jgi:hypothetical protein
MLTGNRLLCVTAIFVAIQTASAKKGAQKEQEETPSGESVLWTDPGDPSSLDFRYGIGGSEHQPQPPFRFLDEDFSGSIAKVNVMDSRGATWNVKFGPEAHASAFCTRLVWACGYFAETEYLVDQGQIEGARKLQRAAANISGNGRFRNGRFQLRNESPKYLEGKTWSWVKNPFVGSREFKGLKLLMLLVSNWDSKDARDASNHMRSNTNLAIFEDNSAGATRYLYADDDWGASMGKWGGTFTWTKWDCKGFADQTADFVKRDKNGGLRWGFNGKHREDLTGDITISDVQWLLQYLGKITDEQLRAGLRASGATPEETECYANALRQRITSLQDLTEGASVQK